jgi:hypothetical protein
MKHYLISLCYVIGFLGIISLGVEVILLIEQHFGSATIVNTLLIVLILAVTGLIDVLR